MFIGDAFHSDTGSWDQFGIYHFGEPVVNYYYAVYDNYTKYNVFTTEYLN